MMLKRFALAAVLLAGALVIPASAQMHKQVNFTISAPFELKNSNVVLPPGEYILYQISAVNPSIFALYKDDMRHTPIAMISTVRIEYSASKYPSKTRILTDIDETSSQNYPVIQGWNIPGESGWEVIAGVTSHHEAISSSYATRRASRSKHSGY
ncbi:MAG TPA: hypothetical protein VLM38_09205 [Blastocatellia bacterium]|nr:hypothetical protein [Blastocatellia bacterium]